METVKSCGEDLQNLLENRPLTERKSFIKSIVKEVRVTATGVLLKHDIPLLTSSVFQEIMVFIPIAHCSVPTCIIY